MERLYVKIQDTDLQRLIRRAQEQRRHPSDEAALLLADALRRHGKRSGDVDTTGSSVNAGR